MSIPLINMSVNDLFNGNEATYEVPVYQRNYAWEKDEIAMLVQDVYDAYIAKKETYYIGTLVTFHKGDHVYEVIDGQQRLTTLYLLLVALDISVKNKLTYRARKKSNDTLRYISTQNQTEDEKDMGIINGHKFVINAIADIVHENLDSFKKFLCYQVQLIRYIVPKDIDLNHYFEIMNSRGEQLEKHEIIKARLIEKLSGDDCATFNRIWEFCSEMDVYIQQKYENTKIFGNQFRNFYVSSFDELPKVDSEIGSRKIVELIGMLNYENTPVNDEKIDSFQPIIDFSNFLLIVLKITRLSDKSYNPTDFNLDDKELISEFDKVQSAGLLTDKFVKKFGFNLLKAKYLLDNYIVHHSKEDDTIESNPWKLQCWQKGGKNEKGYLVNVYNNDLQHKLIHLLSMFEVSFSARQRKNYLFYCLIYLFDNVDKYGRVSEDEYFVFLSSLAAKYFYDVYLNTDNLNEINMPKPGAFDANILVNNELITTRENFDCNFTNIYGDGSDKSAGIPLFIFNYIDYKLWEKYADDLRGERTREGSRDRNIFFETLGCSDFGLKIFEQFYFSRTRRSLEHFYPKANTDRDENDLTDAQINCLGNYAMIGSEANSMGSNWTPKVKLDHYLDSSGKVRQVSVASLKFMVMMQICNDNYGKRIQGYEWNFDDISVHQGKMMELLGVQ